LLSGNRSPTVQLESPKSVLSKQGFLLALGLVRTRPITTGISLVGLLVALPGITAAVIG
jgi:hypothetical protein